jgi:deoxycytidine triphosphate deaminase
MCASRRAAGSVTVFGKGRWRVEPLLMKMATPAPPTAAGEGRAQTLDFESGEACDNSHKDHGGKYQGRRGVTLPTT